MEKRKFFALIVFFVVLALVVWSTAFAITKSKFAYNYNLNGLLVQSNDFEPKTYFAELGNSQNFVVSPELHETVSSVEPYVFGSANTFSVALNGNGKTVTMLIRVIGSDNALKYCLSNLGSVNSSEKISSEKCLEQLDSNSAVKIMVDYPNDSVQAPFVFLEKNRITIKTKDYLQLKNAAFLVASVIYPNTIDIINQSNSLIDKLFSGQNAK